MAKSKKEVPKSVFSRAKKILTATTQLAAKEASLKIKKTIQKNIQGTELETRIEQAIILKNSLSELKGAAMKVGQLISLDVNEYLPKEVTDILSDLQAQSKSVDFSIIEKVLEEELQDKLLEIKDISHTPIAAASIGQVHKASYKNQSIVLKIQYPGIRESIPSDIKMLHRLISSGSSLLGKQMDFQKTLEEIEFVLMNETNYQSELVNVQKFKANLDGHPFFVVPKAFPEISTPSVLALEFMDGVSLNDWIASNPCEQDKIIVAHQLLDLFFKELFDWKIVQTDPNLANYLVQTNPLKIVLLDFGSCLSYTSDFVENYRSFVALSQSQDKAKILQAAVDFELLDSRETEEALDAFVQMLHISSLPFLSKNQPFNFSSLDYERQSRQSILNFVKKLKYTPPPRKILFMHRRLGGLFNTLKKMKIAIDLGPYWEKLQKGG